MMLTAPLPESKVVTQDYQGGRVVEKVACRLCETERRMLAPHLRASHGMTSAEYRQKFPGALTDAPGARARSAACRDRQATAALRRWANPEERAAQSERLKDSAPWKGKRLSEEHRQAIGDGGRGVAHNLSEERRQELADRGRRILTEIRDDPAVRLKQSQAQKSRWELLGGKHPLVQPEARQRSLQTRLKNGTLPPPGGGRGITGFRKGLPHYCRSTLEANFARILLLEGVPYEYEPRVFLLPGGGRWTPDFRLSAPLGEIPAGWVELKGWRKKDGSLPGGASGKIAAFEQMTGESVYVLVQNSPEWRALMDTYSSKVLWERPRFNLRTHPDVFGRCD